MNANKKGKRFEFGKVAKYLYEEIIKVKVSS